MSRLSMGLMAVVLAIGGMARGETQQNWPDTLFAERSHDFGPVPGAGWSGIRSCSPTS